MPNDKPLNDTIMPEWLAQRLKQLALIVVVVVLMAEVLARFLFVIGHPEATYHKEYDRRLAMVQKAPTAEELAQTSGKTLFLMGDSRMMVGGYAELIATKLAQANLPVLVRNTSVSGGTPRMNLFMLKQAMAKGYKPALIAYSAEDLYVGLVEKNTVLASTPEPKLEASYVGRCLYHSPSSAYGQFVCGLEQYSYLARGRRYFKQLLGQWDLALLQTKKYQQVPYDLNTPDWEISAMGWAPGYRVLNPKHAATVFAPSEKSLIEKAKTQAQQVWVDEDWHEFLAFTSAHHIPVVFVWIPEYQTNTLKKHPLVQQRYQLIQQHLAQYAKEYPRVSFINFLKAETDASHFYNRNHLNVLGAVALSTKLAQRLQHQPYRQYLTGGKSE